MRGQKGNEELRGGKVLSEETEYGNCEGQKETQTEREIGREGRREERREREKHCDVGQM